MSKKGFTLIELLAVIVVLGLLMMLIVPTIKEVYNDYKKKVYYESTSRLIKSFEEYYTRSVIKNDVLNCTYNFYNDINDCFDFSFDGAKPKDGQIELFENGEINGCVVFDKYSYSIQDSVVSIVDDCQSLQ